jgi:hypothetical protein
MAYVIAGVAAAVVLLALVMVLAARALRGGAK